MTDKAFAITGAIFAILLMVSGCGSVPAEAAIRQGHAETPEILGSAESASYLILVPEGDGIPADQAYLPTQGRQHGWRTGGILL